MEVKSIFPFKFATDFHAQMFETDPYILCVEWFSVGTNQQIHGTENVWLKENIFIFV